MELKLSSLFRDFFILYKYINIYLMRKGQVFFNIRKLFNQNLLLGSAFFLNYYFNQHLSH